MLDDDESEQQAQPAEPAGELSQVVSEKKSEDFGEGEEVLDKTVLCCPYDIQKIFSVNYGPLNSDVSASEEEKLMN